MLAKNQAFLPIVYKQNEKKKRKMKKKKKKKIYI